MGEDLDLRRVEEAGYLQKTRVGWEGEKKQEGREDWKKCSWASWRVRLL